VIYAKHGRDLRPRRSAAASRTPRSSRPPARTPERSYSPTSTSTWAPRSPRLATARGGDRCDAAPVAGEDDHGHSVRGRARDVTARRQSRRCAQPARPREHAAPVLPGDRSHLDRAEAASRSACSRHGRAAASPSCAGIVAPAKSEPSATCSPPMRSATWRVRDERVQRRVCVGATPSRSASSRSVARRAIRRWPACSRASSPPAARVASGAATS
jgi:hypothetical protein